MPFVADKVIALLQYVVTKTGGDSDEEGDAMQALAQDAGRKKVALKGKIKTVARISKMFATLKNESEMLLKIKSMAPDGKIPRGLLLEGRPAIRDALREFANAKELDKVNERRPGHR